MANTPDGRRNGAPPRRLRFDDLTATALRPRGGESGPGDADDAAVGHSGRRLVVGAGVVMVVLWMILFLAFREWRAKYRERAKFGADAVAPVIDRFAAIDPPGVDPIAWRQAVRDTRDMIRAVTGSNVLGLDQMKSLRDELAAAADRAGSHPETAVAELAGIWDTMAARAEFLLKEGPSGRRRPHPRPAILPPRPAAKGPPAPGRDPQPRTSCDRTGAKAGGAGLEAIRLRSPAQAHVPVLEQAYVPDRVGVRPG